MREGGGCMKCYEIYPTELLEQEATAITGTCDSRNGLVIQVGGLDSLGLDYHHFFNTNRKYIIPGVEGMEFIYLLGSASGMRVFRYLFPYLSLMQKGQFIPAYLDIVTYGGEYKREVKQAYDQSFTIWENHREGYRWGWTVTKPPAVRKSNATYIIEVLEAIEDHIYTHNKLVSKFDYEFMKSVIRKRRGRKWLKK